jgi:hypothetical protein
MVQGGELMVGVSWLMVDDRRLLVEVWGFRVGS